MTALVAGRPDLVADGVNFLGLPCPLKSSRYVAPSAREAAREGHAVIDSTGPARRAAPGGDPTTRLNARANAASER